MQMRRGLPPNVTPMLPEGYQGYEGYGAQPPRPVQSVQEILNQPLGEPTPNLSGVSGSASRQREIADLLMQGVQNQDNTSIAGGLSQLGQAFLARGARKKADTAEAKRDEVASLLMQQALGGDRNAMAQIMPVADILARDDRKERYGVEDEFTRTQLAQGQQGLDLQGRGVDLQERGLDHTITQDQFGNDLRGRELDLNAELGRGNLNLGRENLELSREKFGFEKTLAEAEAEAAKKAGPKREMRQDTKGVWRYIDDQSPVFPDDQPAAKPLIGAESMARVAAGLPTAKQAVTNLRSLIQNSKGTALSMEGYRPGRDWGAGLTQDVGHIPVVGGLVRPATDALSRTIGGKDYQMFEDSYGAYEASILPIMSGAAVTDTEALRQMRAVRIKPGDNEETIERKLTAMDMQLQGLELAARGDVEGFLGMLDEAGKVSGTGPVKRGTGTETDPEIENLVNMYSGAQ